MTGPWGLEIWHENFVVTEFGFYVFLSTESTAVYFLLLTPIFFFFGFFVRVQPNEKTGINTCDTFLYSAVELRCNEPLLTKS